MEYSNKQDTDKECFFRERDHLYKGECTILDNLEYNVDTLSDGTLECISMAQYKCRAYMSKYFLTHFPEISVSIQFTSTSCFLLI